MTQENAPTFLFTFAGYAVYLDCISSGPLRAFCYIYPIDSNARLAVLTIHAVKDGYKHSGHTSVNVLVEQMTIETSVLLSGMFAALPTIERMLRDN